MSALRDGNRRFGSIFNNDINNIIYSLDPAASPDATVAGYRRVLRPILQARPGILAQDVGMPDPVLYRTAVGTPYHQYLERHDAGVMRKILDSGTDPLALTIEECRSGGVRIVASYRMNAEDFGERQLDLHDFGRTHRHLAIPGAHCLDPARPEVFDHRMDIFGEVVREYDVDGIEFDFRRWVHMISDPLVNHPILTRMVTRTRQMLDDTARAKGRERLILGVRVGPSLDTPSETARYEGVANAANDGSCRELGLDVKTWIEGGYVDYVCPSFFWPRWPGLPRTREFVQAAKGRDMGVYPTLFPLPAWMQKKRPETHLQPGDTAKVRRYREEFCNAALRMYQDGADGISTFNWYFHLFLSGLPNPFAASYGYGMPGSMVQSRLLSILGDPQAIREYGAEE